MTPMFTLFPYGSFVMMHFSSDSFGLPLALLQFPVLYSWPDCRQGSALEGWHSPAGHCIACRGRIIFSGRLLPIGANVFLAA